MVKNAKYFTENFGYLLLILTAYFFSYRSWDGAYIDTDNYTLALRLLEWFKNPTWREQKFMLTDYPFGEISHWTRPLDMVLLLCSLPFMLFYSLKEAVFCGGLLVSPLFLLLTFTFLQKIGHSVLDLRSRVALALLLTVQANFRKIFLFYRPDHHAADVFMAAVVFWELLCFLHNKKDKPIIVAAVVSAIGLWVAVENLVLFALILLFLFGCYVFFGYSYAALKKFTVVYALGVTLAWLFDAPYQGWLYPDNGRISVLFAGIAVYVAVSVAIAEQFRGIFRQTLCLGTLAVALAAVLYFGGFMSSPLDESIQESFIARTSEMQNGTGAFFLIYPLLGIGALIMRVKQKENRPFIWLAAIFLGGYFLLGLWAIRFSGYISLFAALAVSYGLNGLKIKNKGFVGLVVLLCLLEIIGFMIDMSKKYELTKPLDFEPGVNIRGIAKIRLSDGAVITDTFDAPFILWYAEQPTIASPYHRNVEGIVDNHLILKSTDEKEVVRLIKKHHAKTVVLPIEIKDDDYYKEPLQNCDKLYGKILGCKNYPQWLRLKSVDSADNIQVLEINENLLPDD